MDSNYTEVNVESQLWISTMKFWLLLIFTTPSVFYSIFVFISFYQKRKKFSLHRRFNFLLILISVLQMTTDLPFVMFYYHENKVILATNSFCLWWNWWDYSTSGLLIFVMAWGSIERHFLIFHRKFFSTPQKRFFFDLLPMFYVCSYPLIFYLCAIVFNSCENQWDYEMLLCIQPCYLTAQPTLATFDFIGNIVVPVLIIVLTNSFLIMRVVWTGYFRQPSWHRKQKLTMQLLFIAIIYITFWLPLTFNGLILTFTSSSTALVLQMDYFFFTVYMVPILLPFMSPSYLKDLVQRLWQRRQDRRVAVFPLGP